MNARPAEQTMYIFGQVRWIEDWPNSSKI